VKTKKYQELFKMVEGGYNLHLLSYDGYDYVEYGLNLREVLFCDSLEWTHVHILNGLLANDSVWVMV
jgi:hypothetical protein